MSEPTKTIKQPPADLLAAMRDSALNAKGGRWAAFENKELDHPDCGRMKFLCVGPTCTYTQAPNILPDTKAEVNWRYVHIGFVDLKTGNVVELESPAKGAQPTPLKPVAKPELVAPTGIAGDPNPPAVNPVVIIGAATPTAVLFKPEDKK